MTLEKQRLTFIKYSHIEMSIKPVVKKKTCMNKWAFSVNLSNGEFLFGSFQILIQSDDSLLVFLRGSGRLLALVSKRSDLLPVALNVVLEHLVPGNVDQVKN